MSTEWASPGRIGIVGGGSAGYLTALAVKKRFPEREVTLVESRAIPIIGVGEATTDSMPAFLHGQLGIDPVALFTAVRPTFKLGIEFEWGTRSGFPFSFGDIDYISAMAHDGSSRTQSLASLLMQSGRVPILRSPDGELHSLLPHMKFGYHLDNAPFVAFLAGAAAQAGILHVDARIDDVLRAEDGSIAGLRSAEGAVLAYDFYVDASGFRSLLVGQTLGVPFSSYAGSLFCDRALVARVPVRTGRMQAYTRATTMQAGWCWQIPTQDEDHVGYVHASSFLDEDAAAAEMKRLHPGMLTPRRVDFPSGRRTEMWRHNVAAVGNSYAFVEPLESTALHMVALQIDHLLRGLAAESHEASERERTETNRSIGMQSDYLRWFLALHYKFNQRLDSPFWRAARADTDVSGVADELERYRMRGPAIALGRTAPPAGHSRFFYNALSLFLLEQDVPHAPQAPTRTRDDWTRHVDKLRINDAYAVSHDEALRILTERPELLRALVDDPRSWCVSAR